MLIRKINGYTQVIGGDQGYASLPIRESIKQTLIAGQVISVKHIETAWEPTPKELEQLNAGASVILSTLNFNNSPLAPQMVYVEESFDEEMTADSEKRKLHLNLEDAMAAIDLILTPIAKVLEEQQVYIDTHGAPKDLLGWRETMSRFKTLNNTMRVLTTIRNEG